MRCFLFWSLPQAGELDEEGYPTEETLQAIRDWPIGHYRQLLEYVRRTWYYPDRVWILQTLPTLRYALSTGGWSGNEELLGALEENRVFWGTCWFLSQRGGYHEFEVPDWAH